MGQLFWGVDIQAEIGEAASPADLPNFVLRKIGLAADATLLSGPGTAATPVDYDVHGGVSEYMLSDMTDKTGIQKGDKKVLIIGKPLADAGIEPEPNDLIIDGEHTYVIVKVRSDAAKAKWVCQCRGR